MQTHNKFNAQPTTVNGQKCASKAEGRRYAELLLLEKAGKIQDLQFQVKYTLIPAQRDADNKLIERECYYVADFVYMQDGKQVVEDTKGCTYGSGYAVFALKRKLMLHVHGIRILETGSHHRIRKTKKKKEAPAK